MYWYPSEACASARLSSISSPLRTYSFLVGRSLVAVGKSDITERKIRILLNPLFEIRNRLLHLARRALIPIETALQIEPVNFRVHSVVFCELLLIGSR